MHTRFRASRAIQVFVFAVALLSLTGALAWALVPASQTGLVSIADPNDCVSLSQPSGGLSGDAGCVGALGIIRPGQMVVSPDGRNLYVASSTIAGSDETGTIAAFTRSTGAGPTLGALTQLSGANACLSWDADGANGVDDNGNNAATVGDCSPMRPPNNTAGAGQMYDVTVSPDGKYVYAIAYDTSTTSTGSLLVFDRSTTEGPAYGALTYKNCYSYGGAGGCIISPVPNARAMALSADGKRLVVIGTPIAVGTDAVASFSRDTATGLLTLRDCLERASLIVGCDDNALRGLVGPIDINLSSDGRVAYAAFYSSASTALQGVLALTVDTDTAGVPGELVVPAGTAWCITQTFLAGCADGRGLGKPYSLALSPEGLSLYARSSLGSEALATMTIAPAGGAAPGSISQAADSSACRSADADANGVGTDAGCIADAGIGGGGGLAISPDGGSLYTTSGLTYSAINAFERASSGALSPPAAASERCIESRFGVDLGCPDGTTLDEPDSIAISPDGASVYVSTFNNRSIEVLRRSVEGPTCTPAAATTAAATAVTVTAACVDADGDAFTRAVATTPSNGTATMLDQAAGTVTYKPNAGFSGTDTFTVAGTDHNGAGAAATITITVKADKVKPVIKLLTVKPAAVRVPKRARIRITLSESAKVKFVVQRRVGRTWKRKSAKTISLPGGKSTVKLTKVIAARTLKSGSWRLVATARDASGNTSKPKLRKFRR
ncbi:MAG: cadherin-like domain-containing protein [Thermoleophilaceae bacterium]|nr:cadherin-like domain-containing protein [Thermoleophilaceae bacterium]